MADDKKPSEHKHLRPQWAGRDIVNKDHGAELDHAAALHEFEGKLPRPRPRTRPTAPTSASSMPSRQRTTTPA